MMYNCAQAICNTRSKHYCETIKLFSASKNITTDKRTSLNEDKFDKLLFLKKNAYLKRNEEKRIDQTYPKRRFSVTDHESALIINESGTLAPSSTVKKVKRR